MVGRVDLVVGHSILHFLANFRHCVLSGGILVLISFGLGFCLDTGTKKHVTFFKVNCKFMVKSISGRLFFKIIVRNYNDYIFERDGSGIKLIKHL